MKQVLIIDESPLYREYLRQKFEENGVDVGVGMKVMDSVSKMRSMAPDLIILDYHLSNQGFMEILKHKKNDPNTANTPVIILANKIEQKQLIELVPYGVKKVFTKPVKIDGLFAAFTELLGMPFNLDETPSIVEVHVNESIIFIEIAQGLNRDKLDLLRFKMTELLELYEIKVPKVIIMLSDIKLSYGDAPNLQKLLSTVLNVSRVKPNYVRILTREEYFLKFLEAQKDFTGIEVVSNLQYAIDGLLAAKDTGGDSAEKTAQFIGDKLLHADDIGDNESVALKFGAETRDARLEFVREAVQNLRIAVIDDDIIIQELIKCIYNKAGATVSIFSNGQEFLDVVDMEEFDLAFLDLIMPKVDGFGVLKALQARDIKYPIIVLSAISQRDTMIKAIQMGVKSYLIKPLKPEDIFKKSLEILRANF